MRVRVLFFGQLKEIVGRAEDEVNLHEGARVSDLFASYGNRFPKLSEFQPSVVASVNQEFAEWRAPLASGDEVAFLPPVSGGERAEVSEDLIRIVRERIEADQIVSGMKAPEEGAVVVFDGIVRNHSRGRQTLYLEYEAYEAMALAKMNQIVEQVHKQFAIHRIAITHRLGRLEIGETSVLIVVTSAHRSAAFDACRFAIDTLKRVVPIWKKEYFADGAVWAEGEIPSREAFSRQDESKH